MPVPLYGSPMSSAERAVLRAVILITALVACAVLGALVGPLVLAAWVAHLGDPLTAGLERKLRGRGRAATVLATLVVLLLVIPLGLVILALAVGARELWDAIQTNDKSPLTALVSGGDGTLMQSLRKLDSREITDLAAKHGASALRFASSALGASAAVAIALLVFVLGVWSFAAEGARLERWLRATLPLPPDALDRFGGAFFETGRGLLIGSGLTALAQGIVAGIAYAALGVPRAFVLGFLTILTALVPSFGTGIVWIPVAAGLALNGQPLKAVILLGLGVGVIGVIDNILRPLLSRYGRLQLPTFVLLLSIFGGLALFGGWGLVLGPLVVRLGREALELSRDRTLFKAAASADVEPPPPRVTP